MPTARRSRTIHASPQELWAVVRDPHHLPRWWPRVSRVEGVEGDAFTEVLRTSAGKIVRADFNMLAGDDDEMRLTWTQQVQGTPFGRLLRSSETEVALSAAPAGKRSDGAATEVTIELRQELNRVVGRFGGFSVGFGSMMVRRAAISTIDGALDGLERISG